MAHPAKRTRLPANQIPTVTVLCQLLGFGAEANRPATDLTDTTQFCRKQYQTPAGIPGKDLTKWKDPSVQEDLRLMVQEYLESRGFGAQLWPARSHSTEGERSGLEYPADKDRISDLLCQLFWRQNAYTHRNAQFGPNRSKKRSRDDGSVNEKSLIASLGLARSHSHLSPTSHIISLPQRGTSASLESPSTKEVSPQSRGPLVASPGPPDRTIAVGTNDEVDQNTGLLSSKSVHNTLDTLAHGSAQKVSSAVTTDVSPHLGEFNIYDFGLHEKSLLRSTVLGSVHPLIGEHPKAPIVVEDAVPLDHSQSIATSRLARTSTETPSPLRRTSRQSQVRHGDQDGNGVTSTRNDEKSENPSTPRRQSKRKRATRARPEVVPPDVDLDAILDENDASYQHTVNDNTYTSFSKHTTPTASQPLKNPPSDIQRAESTATSTTIKPLNAESPSRASTRSIRETTTSTTVKTDGCSTRPTSVSLPPDSEVNTYSTESTKPLVTSKPMVAVRFWIIKARLPRLAYEKWTDGKLQGKSLDFVLEGVSNIIRSSRIRKLKFTLETADKECTYTIVHDAEDEFEQMKQQFSTDMTAAFRKNRNEFKDFHIWIEPIEGEDLARDGEAEVEDALMGEW